ncbi:hypothetical protein V7S79_02275 [Aquirufa sp. ROCK-SH2]
MFSTYFYISILIFQLFISDNAGYYNQNVSKINQLIDKKEFHKAYSEISRVEKSTIFNNHEINQLKILLSIKLNIETKELLKIHELKNFQLPIVLSKIGKTKEALVFLRKDIIKMNNDSLIKLFEVYALERSQTKNKIKSNSPVKQYDSSLDNTDALALLDLMKKKEKFLSYKNNVK